MTKKKVVTEELAIARIDPPKYLCLRDCYVSDRLFAKGEVYDLPIEMEKSEKNFRALEKSVLGPEPVLDSKKSLVPKSKDKPEPGVNLTPGPEPGELPPSPMEPNMGESILEPVVHELVKSKGKKLKCSCGKTYKTEYGLKRHLEDNAK